MPANTSISKWLIVAFAIETFCVTWGLKMPGLLGIFSILYFIACFSIAFLVIRLPAFTINPIRKSQYNKSKNYYRLLAILAFAVLMYFQGRYWIQPVPIDIQ